MLISLTRRAVKARPTPRSTVRRDSVKKCPWSVLLAWMLVTIGGTAHAQSAVDAFDPGANADVYALAVQPDGKILVGGNFTSIGGGGTGTVTRHRLARLDPDGSVDTSFNPGANGIVAALALQPDGKILVGGLFTGLGGGTGTTIRLGIG